MISFAQILWIINVRVRLVQFSDKFMHSWKILGSLPDTWNNNSSNLTNPRLHLQGIHKEMQFLLFVTDKTLYSTFSCSNTQRNGHHNSRKTCNDKKDVSRTWFKWRFRAVFVTSISHTSVYFTQEQILGLIPHQVLCANIQLIAYVWFQSSSVKTSDRNVQYKQYNACDKD